MARWTPILTLLARVLLPLIFVHSAWDMGRDPRGTAAYMASKGMPMAMLFLVGALFLLGLGSLSIILGLATRWGAAALIVFLIPTTLIFHNVKVDPNQMIDALKNWGLLGGLLQLVVYGPGPWSLDARRQRRP
jgi:uncharacterized membrane protein YphA (DoxX/SURF4 family)